MTAGGLPQRNENDRDEMISIDLVRSTIYYTSCPHFITRYSHGREKGPDHVPGTCVQTLWTPDCRRSGFVDLSTPYWVPKGSNGETSSK